MSEHRLFKAIEFGRGETIDLIDVRRRASADA
jgi:hypothetical protein